MTNCFLETFISWMDQNCSGNVEPDRWPCCNSFQFPYSRNVFHFCIMKAMAAIYNTPRSLFIPTSAGPKFSNPMYRMSNQAHFPIIKAVVVEFESNYTFSTSYVNMKRFYNKVIRLFEQSLNVVYIKCIFIIGRIVVSQNYGYRSTWTEKWLVL